MATGSNTLEDLLRKYIDSIKPASTTLKQELQNTEISHKYKLLTEVRGSGYTIYYTSSGVLGSQSRDCTITAVLEGALRRDLEGLRYMLHGLTPVQLYNTMKISSSKGTTPLLATIQGHSRYRKNFTPKDIIKYLMSELSPEHKFNLLKLQHKDGYMVLSHALQHNLVDCIQPLLSSLSVEQQQLWTAKATDGLSAADLCGPAMLSTLQEITKLRETQVEINEKFTLLEAEKSQQEQEVAQLQERQFQLLTELDLQSDAMQAMEERQQAMTERQQASTEWQQAMEMMLEKLQIELSRPICTDETGDQLIEDY